MRMLDLFCGRGGWTNAFLDAGWDVVGVDLEHHSVYRGRFVCANMLDLDQQFIREMAPDFICASSPCEQFSVHGMKMFHSNPPYPELGIKLFEHTRHLCEESGLPYVMENVRAARQFVGNSEGNSGAFYLWGNAVPNLLPGRLFKGWGTKYVDKNGRHREGGPGRYERSTSQERKDATDKTAEIPSVLAKRVAEHAEWVIKEGGPCLRRLAEQMSIPL